MASLAGLRGDELAARAVRLHPDLRVIFASGYDAVWNTGAGEHLTRAVLLRKPYDERSIAEALSAATASSKQKRHREEP